MWWWKYSNDLLSAQFEARWVIGLRMMKLAWRGLGAAQEAEKMVDEKVQAAEDAAITLGSGGSPDQVLSDARAVMRANIKRLSKT